MLVINVHTTQQLILATRMGCLGLNYRNLGYASIFLGAILGTLAGGLPFYYVKNQASSHQIFLFFGLLFIFLIICITGALYVLDPFGADVVYNFDKENQNLRITEKRWYGTSYQDFSFDKIAFLEIIPRDINPEIADLYLYFDEQTRYWVDFGKIEEQQNMLLQIKNFLEQ